MHTRRLMSVLVTYGSKRGGTEGIAQRVAEKLRAMGFTVDLSPVERVKDVKRYQAVLVGGALYMFRWHSGARRFVLKHRRALAQKDVWLFSSGPLDESASQRPIPPLPGVQELVDLVGAYGHATFGGRLLPDAKGFGAAAMTKEHAGDFRDFSQIDEWAERVGRRLQAWAVKGEPHVKPEPKGVRRQWALLVELFLVGASALFGGATLVLGPDGGLIHLPLKLLQYSPFHDFLVPGLLLALVVGLGNLHAVWLQWRRYDLASLVSFVSGGALLVYITVEMIMLRTVHWAHLLYLALGLVICIRSLRLFSAEWKAGVTLPPPPRPV